MVFTKSHSIFKSGDSLKSRVLPVTRSKRVIKQYIQYTRLAVLILNHMSLGEEVSPRKEAQTKCVGGRVGETTAKQAYSFFPSEASHLEQYREEEQFILLVAHC